MKKEGSPAPDSHGGPSSTELDPILGDKRMKARALHKPDWTPPKPKTPPTPTEPPTTAQ